MQTKGEWLEKLLNGSNPQEKKKKRTIDPWEVEFMYRPTEVAKEVVEVTEKDNQDSKDNKVCFII
jgi:hypothetical protein